MATTWLISRRIMRTTKLLCTPARIAQQGARDADLLYENPGNDLFDIRVNMMSVSRKYFCEIVITMVVHVR
jgi:hypothetical protein